MGRIRFMGTLGFLAAIIVCWTFLRAPSSAQEKEKPPPGEQVLIGPFQVDELYKNGDDRDGLKEVADNGGPSLNDMLKTMKQWKIYILDRKVKEKDRWVWDRPEKNSAKSEYPKILLEGKPNSSFKDANGKDFTFNLKEWSDFTYTLNQYGNKPDHIAEMAVGIHMQFGFRKIEIKLGNGFTREGDTFGFRTAGIWYDVTGKNELMKDKANK
jgi:hypothetical protein